MLGLRKILACSLAISMCFLNINSFVYADNTEQIEDAKGITEVAGDSDIVEDTAQDEVETAQDDSTSTNQEPESLENVDNTEGITDLGEKEEHEVVENEEEEHIKNDVEVVENTGNTESTEIEEHIENDGNGTLDVETEEIVEEVIDEGVEDGIKDEHPVETTEGIEDVDTTIEEPISEEETNIKEELIVDTEVLEGTGGAGAGIGVVAPEIPVIPEVVTTTILEGYKVTSYKGLITEDLVVTFSVEDYKVVIDRTGVVFSDVIPAGLKNNLRVIDMQGLGVMHGVKLNLTESFVDVVQPIETVENIINTEVDVILNNEEQEE